MRKHRASPQGVIDAQGVARDALQFVRLVEAKYVIVVDEDVRQSLAESIAAIIIAVATHAAELRT